MILYKIWLSIIGVFFTLIFGLILIVVGIFDKNKRYTSTITRLWAKNILIFSFIKYKINGSDKIINNNNYVFVSNHQSGIDILLTFALIKTPISFLTKKELFSIPIFGLILKSAGMVYVDRFNKDKSKLSIDLALEKLNTTSLSILVYPESTRTNYKLLKEFKKGAFILAIQSGKPIIPLTLIYNNNPRSSLINNEVTLVVGDVINSLDYNIEQKDDLLVKVKEVIQKNLEISNN